MTSFFSYNGGLSLIVPESIKIDIFSILWVSTLYRYYDSIICFFKNYVSNRLYFLLWEGFSKFYVDELLRVISLQTIVSPFPFILTLYTVKIITLKQHLSNLEYRWHEQVAKSEEVMSLQIFQSQILSLPW
jgi:hypothetical protein